MCMHVHVSSLQQTTTNEAQYKPHSKQILCYQQSYKSTFFQALDIPAGQGDPNSVNGGLISWGFGVLNI